MMLPQFYMDDLIRQAIREDINYIDTSADYLIPPVRWEKLDFLPKRTACSAACRLHCACSNCLIQLSVLSASMQMAIRSKRAISSQSSAAAPPCCSRASAPRSTSSSICPASPQPRRRQSGWWRARTPQLPIPAKHCLAFAPCKNMQSSAAAVKPPLQPLRRRDAQG